MKRYYKRCNKVFEKTKMRLIDKVEHEEYSYLIQVSSQEKLEAAIMKKNSSRFKLACNSFLLEGNLHLELGLSDEGKLAEEILSNRLVLQEYSKIKEVLQLF